MSFRVEWDWRVIGLETGTFVSFVFWCLVALICAIVQLCVFRVASVFEAVNQCLIVPCYRLLCRVVISQRRCKNFLLYLSELHFEAVSLNRPFVRWRVNWKLGRVRQLSPSWYWLVYLDHLSWLMHLWAVSHGTYSFEICHVSPTSQV